MKGLRKNEGEKFHRFFALIQTEAEKQDSIFFADAGDGNDFETSTMEGEKMMGWLIPTDKAKEFELMWEVSEVDDTWSEYYTWAIWAKTKNGFQIFFDDSPRYLDRNMMSAEK